MEKKEQQTVDHVVEELLLALELAWRHLALLEYAGVELGHSRSEGSVENERRSGKIIKPSR